MSELLLVPPEGINESVEDYSANLRYFTDTYDIPPGLLAEPDHLVIKAADSADFADKVRAIKPFAEGERLAFIQLDWRFLAIARLAVPYPLAPSRYVDTLEIMEPKVEPGNDFIGVEYAEFYYPNINHAEILLKSRSLRVERYNDESRNWRWLNVKMNEKGQEFRLSDTKLIEIVEEELQDGTARLI